MNAPFHGGAETVLVVEDDEDVRETAVAILADLGYRVLKARDAASALHVIESGAPVDLLFTDVVMPGPLRSPELARKAKERLPDIAVLFTSGYTENAIVHGGRLDAGVELLSKPYTREALARKVRHVLGNQGQSRLLASGQLAAPAGPTAPEHGAEQTMAGTRPLAVLVVEDDSAVRGAVAGILVAQRHDVVEASNAVSALKALAARQFDVLLTDIGLPGPSGVDLAHQALSRWPALAVVFATGHREVAASAQLPNAVVLVKPYLPGDLVRAVAQATTRSRTGVSSAADSGQA